MATDEEKCKIAKLLLNLEVPEVKLTERCNALVDEFRAKFGSDIAEEEMENITYENPYIADKELLEENERKLHELLATRKRSMKESKSNISISDPKRPWRTNSTKERLLRIENELKRHFEKGNEAIKPMDDGDMKALVKDCEEESLVSPSIAGNRLRETVEEARRNLPNFQYKVDNTTATAILPEAHNIERK